MPEFERDLVKIRTRLAKEGWQVLRNDGDHTVYAHPDRKGRVIVPKGRGDLPVRNSAQHSAAGRLDMTETDR